MTCGQPHGSGHRATDFHIGRQGQSHCQQQVLPFSLVPAAPRGCKPDTRIPFLGGNPARTLRDTGTAGLSWKRKKGRGPRVGQDLGLTTQATAKTVSWAGHAVLLPVSSLSLKAA